MTDNNTLPPEGAKPEETYEDYIVTLDRAGLLKECRKMGFQICCIHDAVLTLIESRKSRDDVMEAANSIIDSLDYDITQKEDDWLVAKDRVRRVFPLSLIKGGLS